MKQPARQRALLGIGDQFLVSAGNFALLAAAAGAMSVLEFGAFAVAQTVLLLGLGLFGALYNEPALLDTRGDGEEQRLAAAEAAGAVVQLASVVAVLIALLALLFDGVLQRGLLGLALALPALALQDSLRFQLLALQHPGGALCSDIVFLVAWVTGIGALGTAGDLLGLQATLAVAALVAVGVQVRVVGTRPVMLGGMRAVAVRRAHVVRPLLSEFLSFGVVGQASTLAVAGIVGLPALAGLRAAQAIYGPVNTLQNAIRIAVTPEFVRRPPTAGRSRRALELLNLGVAFAVGLCVVLVLALPDSVGEVLFGQTWELAVPLLLAVGAQRVAAALYVAPLVGLRATGRTAEAASVRIGGALLTAVAILVAALVGDVRAVAWTMTTTSLLTAVGLVVLWRRPRR